MISACAALDSSVARPPSRTSCDRLVVQENRELVDGVHDSGQLLVDRDGVPYVFWTVSHNYRAFTRGLSVVAGRWQALEGLPPEPWIVRSARAGRDGNYLWMEDPSVPNSKSPRQVFRGPPWTKVAEFAALDQDQMTAFAAERELPRPLPLEWFSTEAVLAQSPPLVEHANDANRPAPPDRPRLGFGLGEVTLHVAARPGEQAGNVVLGKRASDDDGCPWPRETFTGWNGRRCRPRTAISTFERAVAIPRSQDIIVVGTAWTELSDSVWSSPFETRRAGWYRTTGRHGHGALMVARVTPDRVVHRQYLPVTFDEQPSFAITVDRYDRVHLLWEHSSKRWLWDISETLSWLHPGGSELHYIRLGCD